MHAWGVQFHLFWACHALQAQNFRGVIGACLVKQVHHFKCALGAPVHCTFFGAVPCHLRYAFGARCLTAPSSVHKQGARRYEAWGPIFRRVPTNKVLDAMIRGRHLCGMGTATVTCCHQPGRTQRGSSTRASMRTLNATHRAPATTRPTAVMEGAPAASYAPPERGGRLMRCGRRRRPWKGRWSSRRLGRPRGHDR